MLGAWRPGQLGNGSRTGSNVPVTVRGFHSPQASLGQAGHRAVQVIIDPRGSLPSTAARWLP